MPFPRLITAMVTPFDDAGAIDWPTVDRLVDHLIAHGSEGIVVAGTTGESPTLTEAEKLALFERVKARAAGRAQVIAGTGTNDTAASIRLTREAEALGVDGVMLVVPYYNRPSQRGLYEHFRAVAEATSLPIMLYNVPGRTGANLAADTVIALSRIDNIVAVKEASGDLTQMARILEEARPGFQVLSGDDKMLLPLLAIGGHGVVSVAAHIVGDALKELIEAFLAGEVVRAAALHRRYLPIFEGLFFTASPAPVKAALAMMGLPVGGLRLPLVPLNAEERNHLRTLLVRVLGEAALVA
ncbi:MAG: 4-hydroxy-tetrahydrodipicolinate synthase [Hydrogenibacillus schlegelii]|uniref:4-hydroxy-tetrahydrodipicolinate synthase n=1 Tax=Hydrogenibacillus schlegelii TaxID=1484 RepID=A0A2T5GD89_HYDSH|nr:4-hydroxy-tetrahydrodipicolinate synthase [Hydrogenibacillus schlegelii]MBT9282851.1 4-hydroxy-tetrahydrodipicolinate synthase [Hydrogenibacillus schlegelii]PTQ54130.1 MAG: 4-hydroxy-tetrahydrodipicolinate synthase [Hydrogenibacillus schlegelii]